MGVFIKKLKKEKNYIYFHNKKIYYIFYYENKKIFKFKKSFFKEMTLNSNVLFFLNTELNKKNIYYFNFLKKKLQLYEIKKILLNNFISKKDYLTEYVSSY